MLGRRGPVQAAFTPPELKELGELAGAEPLVNASELELDPVSAQMLELDRERARRNVDLLQEYAAQPLQGKPRRIVLRFLVSPLAILGEDRVEGSSSCATSWSRRTAASLRARPARPRRFPAGLVLRSVGYQGVALPGVPFDERRGTIPNEQGRVTGAERTYVAGWIKRGPSGVIGTNKKDATETIELLLADARAGKLAARTPGDLAERLDAKGAAFVDYEGWQAIDAAERAAGAPLNRPRVKLTSWESLLDTGCRRPRATVPV